MRPLIGLVLLALSASTVLAAPRATDWGLRVGFAEDPDQLVAGVQLDLGEISPGLRLRPDLELGFGDDHTIVALAAPVHYRFDLSGPATPYVGAGVVLGFIDRDAPRRGDDSDVELAGEVIGGVEWALASGRRITLELDIVIGDIHDAALLVGLNF